MKRVVATLAVWCAGSALAQSSLENPQPASYQSGIGLVSGWSCASNVQVLIDGIPYTVAHGTARADVASTCGGNPNVGFGLLINYNTLGSGPHSAQLRIGSANAGPPAQFTVTSPAGEFIVGLTGTVTIPGFPAANKTTTLQWQQSQQNFAIKAVDTNATTAGFPISFQGMRLDSLTAAVAYGNSCDLTLTFTNTSGVSHTPYFYFDIVQGGIIKDQVIFSKTSIGPGAIAQDTSTVLIGSGYAPCGTFTAQFNSAASHVYTP